MIKRIAAVALMLALPAGAFAQDEGDAKKGKKVFKKCVACHKIDGKTAVGPPLNGVVGRAAGAVEGYKYSDAMKNSGLTWDAATLDEYLANPKKKIPGNKMVFIGLKKNDQRKDVIAYLATLTE